MSDDRRFDHVLDTLGDRYRRRLLVSLSEHNPQDDDPRASEWAVRDASDAGADEEAVRLVLFHNHLPRLKERGYVSWDREAGTIERGPNWTEVEPLLRLLDAHRDELPDGWL